MTRLEGERYAILRTWALTLAVNKAPLDQTDFDFLLARLPTYRQVQLHLQAAAQECSRRAIAIEQAAAARNARLTISQRRAIDLLMNIRHNHYVWGQMMGRLEPHNANKRRLRQLFYHDLVGEMIDQRRKNYACLNCLPEQVVNGALPAETPDGLYSAVESVARRTLGIQSSRSPRRRLSAHKPYRIPRLRQPALTAVSARPS
jgi:hypothetical protein